MDIEPGFCRAEITQKSPLVRPQKEDRNSSRGSQAGIFGATEIETVTGAGVGELAIGGIGESGGVESVRSVGYDEDTEDYRAPKLPREFRKPTKREVAEHLPSHWPFRSWCRHCVAGRAASSHHKTRSDVDREFARSGVPTISIDHCFLGSREDEEHAHSRPYLIMYDNASEAIYAVAVPDKCAHDWIAEYAVRVIADLGYSETMNIYRARSSELHPAFRVAPDSKLRPMRRRK